MNEEIKYCKFCGKEKPIKDFVKSGFCVKNICKDCNNKKQKDVYKNSKNYHKLQQENKQLKEQLIKYTDPKDLTLMFMYCDEKAKDKIKCLEKENQQLKEQLEISEKARKEAIELINNINDWEICSKYDCMYKDDVLDVLRVLDIDKGE